jgi:hypothetical protein
MMKRVFHARREEPLPAGPSAASIYASALRDADWESILADVYLDGESISSASAEALYEKLRLRTAPEFDTALRAVSAELGEMLQVAAYDSAVQAWEVLTGEEPDALTRTRLWRDCAEISLQTADDLIADWRYILLHALHELVSQRLSAPDAFKDIAEIFRMFLIEGGHLWSKLSKREQDAKATAAALGAEKVAMSLGVQWKSWHTNHGPNVCGDCEYNERQGRIAISEAFYSGHRLPPAHPNCRCWVIYYLGR